MAKRKAISKKVRFDIFKRDLFTCQYCGAHPPKVILHVDHIVPVAEGGGNEDTNLITACDTCNLGKSATPLTEVPDSLQKRAADVSERESQIKGYSAVMAKMRARIEGESWEVAEIFMDHFGDTGIRRDWFSSVKTFVEKIGVHECMRAMEKAASKRPHSKGQCFWYFCGICWNVVREGDL